MDNRKAKRSRSSTVPEDGFWDCSFCTYRNRSESFKCEMCNIRKGTSTRKPRMTQVTQQFVKIENQIEQERKKEKRKEILLKTRANRKSINTSNSHNKFANAQTISITVNDVTVFITDIELSLENENDFLNTSNEHGTSGGGKTSNTNNASANNSNGKSEKRTKNGHRNNNKDHKNSETNSDTATNNHTSDSTHNLDENNASNSDFNDADSNLNNNFSKLNNGHQNGTPHDFNENSSNNNETEDKDTATNHSDSE